MTSPILRARNFSLCFRCVKAIFDLTGYARQISLGASAFMMIGAANLVRGQTGR